MTEETLTKARIIGETINFLRGTIQELNKGGEENVDRFLRDMNRVKSTYKFHSAETLYEDLLEEQRKPFVLFIEQGMKEFADKIKSTLVDYEKQLEAL